MNATSDTPSLTGSNLYDVERIRAEFPILHQQVHGKPLVYLDNGATSQKPRAVIDALTHYYENDNANVHRGVHALSERATNAYEHARTRAAQFVNATDSAEIVFTRGTTESINLVAQAWARPTLREGDEIIVSMMEHHSNIVPWQMVCEQTGARLRPIPVTDIGELDMDAFRELLGPRTRLVSVTHVSNALGTINPVQQIAAMAREVGALVMFDGAQGAPHLRLDMQALDCDFYAFSGHKIYAPTGIGVLWARRKLLEQMQPYQGGGEMIRTVSFEGTTYHQVPHKFEAGTPNIGGAVGLAAAMDYIGSLDIQRIAAHEDAVLEYATAALGEIDGLRIIGQSRRKAGIISFVIDGAHAHDVGTIVDSQGVAIRVGHHCAMPLHEHFGLAASARASLACYNTTDEIDALVKAIWKARQMLTA
ncbi:MAG: cysteine desulfurase [Gammaproteobacteria bacterium]|nr:cysteine desulfurase [Gammaproteobacteria bacterium]